jgi:tRNA A-37 threonylcarbamoyl transferase component Bud32
MRECPRCEACYEDDVVVCPDDAVETKHTLPGPALLNGRYLLVKRIGRGAMGQVYLARDQNLVTRRVAVKTVRPDILNDEDMQEGEAIARFEREARAAASIQHPNIVDVTDFGKSPDGVFFLVMEYVEGETLYQLLRREGTLNLKRATALLGQIVAGVEAAHDRSILHRDLKPANIFIMQQMRRGSAGDDGFVKVGDFGLAKIVHSENSETLNGPASRGIVGTPEYMAPEQMREGYALDVRADIYALGAIAYHMLGGRPPFTGNITQLIAQKLLETPASLTTLRSDISNEADQVVMHALAREPEQRPASTGEWFEAFVEAVAAQGEKPEGDFRVVIMAPAGSEVYVDDERQGSVGRSGRVVLTTIPPGQHVLRVARLGEPDDERVIEIRPDSAEQIITAQFNSAVSSEHLSPSRGGSLASRTGTEPVGHAIVVCTNCHARFAEGVKFCGSCGHTSFQSLTAALSMASLNRRTAQAQPQQISCPRCSKVYPVGTRFCGNCGIPIGISSLDWKAPRPVEVLCKHCGASYPAASKFCGGCGKPLNP